MSIMYTLNDGLLFKKIEKDKSAHIFKMDLGKINVLILNFG